MTVRLGKMPRIFPAQADSASMPTIFNSLLNENGYATATVANGEAMDRWLQQNQPDLIILDLMLPGMDGITLCKQLRSQADSQIPVLMLTARDTLSSKLEGFEAGADDYLVKPFEMSELIARIKVLCKRSGHQETMIYTIGDLVVDQGRMSVKRSDKIIDLNPTCFKLLVCLMKNHPNIVKKTEIEFFLWGDTPPESDILKSHIYLLRNKIDKAFIKKLIQY